MNELSFKSCCKKWSTPRVEDGDTLCFDIGPHGRCLAFEYFPRWREYKSCHGEFSSLINFCPFCGTKFLKELSDEWYEILAKEYGIESPSYDDRDKVPQEFWTDEWWKKRGL